MSETGQNLDPETIEMLGHATEGGGRWRPMVGAEMLTLMNYLSLDENSRATVQDEAVAILSKCVPPSCGTREQTGLVIGYVQSGKTMSFTAVGALAHDNGYRVIVVITGVSVPLFEQSKRRLVNDLRLLVREDRKWQHFSNPNPRGNDQRSMTDTLAEWNDPTVPDDERKTILITVMKNHQHLENLRQVLMQLDLRNVPSLIIDDEADQAGLNTKVAQGTESPTYQRLVALRNLFPCHTFLQYTATPQAPLLINLIDVLSPDFAELLTPGPEYVGGRELFLEHRSQVRTIPPNQIPTANNRLTEPPSTLLEAMRIFFLGVAAGLVLNQGRGNRSMMIHPSQLRTGHRQYFNWVTQVKEQWRHILELDEYDPDRRELYEDFRGAYDDLRQTVISLPSLDVLATRLHHAIVRTQIEEVNATRGKTPQIDWSREYPHLLVGGQAMDRGFTVEGLTVTYMPRSVGVGNADSVQQRARFFGYKRSYLGYCRIYLESGVRDAYAHYIEHEEDVRARLIEHRQTNQPSAEWKRAFFLDRSLRPTRRNVLQLDYMQDTISDDWYWPKAPNDSDEATQRNREIVSAFISPLLFQEDEGHQNRTPQQKHIVSENVPLRVAYEQFLTRLRMTRGQDSQRFTGALLQIEAYLERHPDALCTVYQMSGGAARERTVDRNNEIPTLFQGANFGIEQGNRVMTYPGDAEIRAVQGLTIQIHNLTILGPDAGQRTVSVPTIAVWVPAQMAADWVVQENPTT